MSDLENWTATADDVDKDGSWEVGCKSERGLPVLIAYGLTEDVAHIISAAPEMFEAIEQALSDMADSHCVCEATKQMLRAALGKAVPTHALTSAQGATPP